MILFFGGGSYIGERDSLLALKVKRGTRPLILNNLGLQLSMFFLLSGEGGLMARIQ